MTRAVRSFLRLAIPAAIAALVALSPARAGDTPQPDIPKAAAGTQCVQPVDFMRRNHMSMLKHDRDGHFHGWLAYTLSRSERRPNTISSNIPARSAIWFSRRKKSPLCAGAGALSSAATICR